VWGPWRFLLKLISFGLGSPGTYLVWGPICKVGRPSPIEINFSGQKLSRPPRTAATNLKSAVTHIQIIKLQERKKLVNNRTIKCFTCGELPTMIICQKIFYTELKNRVDVKLWGSTPWNFCRIVAGPGGLPLSWCLNILVIVPSRTVHLFARARPRGLPLHNWIVGNLEIWVFLYDVSYKRQHGSACVLARSRSRVQSSEQLSPCGLAVSCCLATLVVQSRGPRGLH